MPSNDLVNSHDEQVISHHGSGDLLDLLLDIGYEPTEQHDLTAVLRDVLTSAMRGAATGTL